MHLVNEHFEKNCPLSGIPLALAVITTCVCLILCFLNVLGNILIILSVVLDPNKNLRTPFSWLIVNLAAADLITGTLTDPISVSIHFKLCLGKKNTDAEHTVLHMSYFISCTASALSIASLAVERYLAVRKPTTYRNKMTNKRIMVTVAVIWLISLTLPNIYFEVGYILYSFVFVNASLVLAISITCFTYFLMWRKIKERSHKTIANHNRGIASFSSTECEESRSSSTALNNSTTSNPIITSTNKMEEKVTKMFLVVLIAMFCCYGPATLFIYLINFCESCGCVALHWFLDLAFISILISTSLNFFCYAMQSSRFRSALIKILKIKRKIRRHYETVSISVNISKDICARTTDTRKDVQMEEILEKPDASDITEQHNKNERCVLKAESTA